MTHSPSTFAIQTRDARPDQGSRQNAQPKSEAGNRKSCTVRTRRNYRPVMVRYGPSHHAVLSTAVDPADYSIAVGELFIGSDGCLAVFRRTKQNGLQPGPVHSSQGLTLHGPLSFACASAGTAGSRNCPVLWQRGPQGFSPIRPGPRPPGKLHFPDMKHRLPYGPDRGSGGSAQVGADPPNALPGLVCDSVMLAAHTRTRAAFGSTSHGAFPTPRPWPCTWIPEALIFCQSLWYPCHSAPGRHRPTGWKSLYRAARGFIPVMRARDAQVLAVTDTDVPFKKRTPHSPRSALWQRSSWAGRM